MEKKLTTPRIWKILNKAVRGKLAVYDLACAMNGLSEDVIRDIADKIHNDLYLDRWDWRQRAKIDIQNKKEEQKIRELTQNE